MNEPARACRIARAAGIAAAALLIVVAAAWFGHREVTPATRTRTMANPSDRDPGARSPTDATRGVAAESIQATRDSTHPSPTVPGDGAPKLDAPIRGVVVDPDGPPIAGATIQSIDWLGKVVETSATDSNGRFVLGRLEPGTRYLHVAAPGRVATILAFGAPDLFRQFPALTNDARIVLEPGAVAVARLRFVDGSPCAGVAVHLGPSHRGPSGVDHELRLGPWPPPVTDEHGRVVIDGLPRDRIVGLGIDLLGGEGDSPRPLATGAATSAAAASEQLFVYPKVTKLTVELRGLEEMESLKLQGDLRLARNDGSPGELHRTVPPFELAFDRVVMGADYLLRLDVGGRASSVLEPHLKVVEADSRRTIDCTLPPVVEGSPGAVFHDRLIGVALLHPDKTPISKSELLDSGWSLDDVTARYGDLGSGTEAGRVGLGEIVCGLGSEGPDRESCVLIIPTRQPIWIEGVLGSQRSRVELADVTDPGHIAFTFDLAALAIGRTRLTVRVRDGRGSDVPDASLLFTESSSGAETFARATGPGLITRMLSRGRYHYQCFSNGGGFSEGDFELPSGSPVTADVVLPDPGSICGTVAPLPDATCIRVTRSPVRGVRTRFDWWGGCTVGPDGSYALDGVPPGEWRLLLTIVAPDESSTRVEVATVTVNSDAITRLDFAAGARPTKRFRLELGEVKSALVHATDAHGETVFDGVFAAGKSVDLPAEALHFSAWPEFRGAGAVSGEVNRWTQGTITGGADGVSIVRFDFPGR